METHKGRKGPQATLKGRKASQDSKKGVIGMLYPLKGRKEQQETP